MAKEYKYLTDLQETTEFWNMEAQVPGSEETYWIVTADAANLGFAEGMNTYAAPENSVPVEPIQLQVEIGHSLAGEGTSSGYASNSSRKNERAKCICVDCFPLVSALCPDATPQFLQCSICEKTFSKCKYYRRHIGLHAKTKSHKCDLCNLAFMFAYQLEAHRLTHILGQKPFKCKTCQKSFTSKYYLKQHQWSHNPVSSYCCRFCGKGYNSEGFFRRHELSHMQ